MPVLEGKAIGSVAISDINNELRTFRDLATWNKKREMDNHFHHSPLNQPHTIMIFEDTNEYQIAGGALTTHPNLENQYNSRRLNEGKTKSRKMKSGVVFSTKENPQQELVRLDIFKEDVTPQASEIIGRIAERGYIVFDAEFSLINTSEELTGD